jgi:hypothetical protein
MANGGRFAIHYSYIDTQAFRTSWKTKGA